MTESHIPSDLDKVFEALANDHRRAIIYALSLQPNSIHQLASGHKLSLPAIHKHLKILLKANMIRSKKIGRTKFLALRREPLMRLQEWLTQYQVYWGNDAETLENYVKHLNTEKEPNRK